MDLRLLDAEPTEAERAAVDHVLGPPALRLGRGNARRRGRRAGRGRARRARRARRVATCCCRRSTPSRSTSAGSARARSTTSARRLTVPPADAYGVATFYALFSLDWRPPRVVHVCEDLACRCHGADELIAELEQRFGPEGGGRAGRLGDVVPEPLPRPVRAGAGSARHDAGPHPAEHVLAPVGVDGVIERARRRGCGRRPADGRAPAARRSGPAAPAPRGRRRPGEPRRLPGARRLPALYAGRSSSARRASSARSSDSKLVGRGGAAFPTGPQVGSRRAPAGATALPRLQRRRVRAGHVQGSRADRGRSVRADRGDDDRRATRRAASAATSTCAASTRRRSRSLEHAFAEARARGVPRRRRPRPRLRVRRRGPQGRGRVHLRRGDGDLQLDRGLPRRAAQQAAVPGRRRASSASRPSSTTSRRSSTCSTSCCEGGPAFAADRHRGLDRHEALLRLAGTSSDPASTRSSSERRSASCSIWPAASPAAGALQTILLGGAAGGFVGPDELDLPLTLEDARAAGDDPRLGRRPRLRRHGRPAPRC